MERWHAKLLALVGSFVLPLLVTLLPYKLSDYVAKKGDLGKRVLSCLMCFGGGIFFGTYLIHMGPEVQLLLQTALLEPYKIHYPVQNLLTGLGFFFVLFSEKLVMKWNKRRLDRKRSSVLEVISVKDIRNGDLRTGLNADCELDKPWEKRIDGNAPMATGILYGVDKHKIRDSETRIKDNGNTVEVIDSTKTVSEVEQWKQQVGNNAEQQQQQQHHHNHHHSTRSIILIVALSMHRIFEGMTIGLQSSIYNIWSLFLAVMCHELVIGFSLGLQLVKSRLTLRRMAITTFICSIIMPVGVAVGIILTELGKEDPSLALANGVLQAIAMGTFIYVTFFEILQEEVDPNDTSLSKVFFIFAGFVMMALLDLIPEEDTSLNIRHLVDPVSLVADVTTSSPL